MGSGTVIEACADGRRAAKELDTLLTKKQHQEQVTLTPVTLTEIPRNIESDEQPATPMNSLPVPKRKPGHPEVELGYNIQEAVQESNRCYLCHYRFEIDEANCIYCLKCIEVMPTNCITLTTLQTFHEDGTISFTTENHPTKATGIIIDNDACIRCGKCVQVCPTDCISIHRSEWINK